MSVRRVRIVIALALALGCGLVSGGAERAAAAGWAVGTGGTILKSIDGGANWTSSNPVGGELRALHFVDDNLGWAVGLGGTVLKTSNGGTNWTSSFPTGAILHSVFFASSTTGWAVGTGGTILKTINGGTSWTSSFPTGAILNSVFFVSTTTGWAVGTGGTILKTVNGGTNWTSSFPTGAILNSVYFIDGNTGWAVGTGGTILKTVNGGTNWTASNQTGAILNSVFFVSSSTGWAVGTGGTVLKTINGGTSWTSSFPTGAILNSVYFIDGNTGWAAGTGGTVLKTVNAGTNWSATNPTGAVLNDVQFVSIPTFVAVTVQTSPAGRSFSVDGTTYTSTQAFSWLAGSSHTIATTWPQSGASGTRYAFANWSDGGAISHAVAPTLAATYTASFTTQYQLTMNAGAGGAVAPATGWQNAGASVAISASPNAGFSFGVWAGSGSGSYDGSNNPAMVTMNGPIIQTASFVANVSVTVNTSPAGRSFSVDGAGHSSPQSFSWIPGSSHTVATTSPQAGAAGTQYAFSSWSDGGAMSHNVAPTAGATYTATFITQHQLTMSAGTGGTASPATGWQNAGASVSIGSTPDAGYAFGGWTGAGPGSYTGGDNPAAVTMNGPITQQASFVASTATEFFDPAAFQAGSPPLVTASFDGRAPGNGALTGNEFASWGLTILQRDGHPINLLRAGIDNPFVPAANANSAPNVISSSAGIGVSQDISDHFDFVFTPVVSAAGLWIGNVSPGTTEVQFLDAGGAVIASEVIDNAHPGIVGTGLDNRIFYGIASTQPIERIRTVEGPSDGDAIVYDDVQFAGNTVDVGDPDAAVEFTLHAPWPNPSGGGVGLSFSLPHAARVSLEIFDLHGRRVATPLDAALPAGRHVCAWRGSDAGGAPVACGVYVARLQADGLTRTRRMTLIR